MRKFILIAALVLASATAQAGGSRSLTLASNEQPAAAEQPKAVEQKAVEQKPVGDAESRRSSGRNEAPKFVARPAAVGTAAEAPRRGSDKPAAEKTTKTTSLKSRSGGANRPKRA